MLLDLLGYLITPCSWQARSMGFLTSTLQVQARYRRCRQAWEPHLAQTRQVILEAARACPQRRTAVILGAGLLHDIPLRDLAGIFREVILVDLVFPWSSRLSAARFRNVRCCPADVTATIHALARAARDPTLPLPVSEPSLLLREATLDLTVSVNLLTQLPVIPRRYLERVPRDEPALEAWSRHLQSAHLDYLRRLSGRQVLITDTGGLRRDHTGTIIEQWDNLHGLELPPADRTWEWNLAPAPEADPDLDHLVAVAGYSDW